MLYVVTGCGFRCAERWNAASASVHCPARDSPRPRRNASRASPMSVTSGGPAGWTGSWVGGVWAAGKPAVGVDVLLLGAATGGAAPGAPACELAASVHAAAMSRVMRWPLVGSLTRHLMTDLTPLGAQNESSAQRENK